MKPDDNQSAKTPAKAPAKAKPVKGIKINLTAKQLRLVLIGLSLLAIIVFFATAYVGLNVLKSKSQQLVDTKLKSTTVEAQLASLGKAKKQVEKYNYFNDVAATVLPNDKDQAQAVLDIYKLANQSGIAIGSITFPASTLGGKSASATSSTSSSAAISQAKPVSGIDGLYSLSLIVTPQITPTVTQGNISTYPKFLDFLSRIENDRRTAQIAQINIEPQLSNGAPSEEINFNLIINVFIRPQK